MPVKWTYYILVVDQLPPKPIKALQNSINLQKSELTKRDCLTLYKNEHNT